MWVAAVVAGLVVDRRDIACDASCQLLGKCPHQSLALLVCGFDRQGDDEPLTDAPFAPLCGILRLLRSRSIRRLCQALSQHLTGCLGSRDVAQMCSGLPDLRCAALGGPLLRKGLH